MNIAVKESMRCPECEGTDLRSSLNRSHCRDCHYDGKHWRFLRRELVNL